jgi:NAD-dependent deacetylase
VWAWYLYRRGVCRRAAPNAGHRALVTLARSERFALVTQNVDGLHIRAGSPRASTYEIHGDIELARCADECTPDRFPIPDQVPDLAQGEAVSDAARAALVCPRCGAMARPHVLWFDESYDEERFHLDTVRRVAREAALLVVAGTSAQTNLPWQVVSIAGQAGAVIVDVNIEDNPFGDLAHAVARTSAATALPLIVDTLAHI